MAVTQMPRPTMRRMPRRATIPAANAREAILSAAESTFIALGYDGTSMREIAEAAGVAQALLHYHFQTKENLYEAVFERRSSSTSKYRVELLRELMETNPSATLEDVLRILFISNRAASGRDDGSADQYVQLVARVCVAQDDRSRDIVERHFDPIAQAFVDALLRVVPGLLPQQAILCYLFAFSLRIQAQAIADRATRLGAARGLGPATPDDLTVPFVAAGIRAMVQNTGRTPAAPSPAPARKSSRRTR